MPDEKSEIICISALRTETSHLKVHGIEIIEVADLLSNANNAAK